MKVLSGVKGMAIQEKEIDITRNIKLIEWLKSELLTDLASLFRALAGGARDQMHEVVSDMLSNIILISYLLGKRLGVSYNAIELKIHGKVKLGLVENNDVEKYYGDLSELSRHLGSFRRKEQ